MWKFYNSVFPVCEIKKVYVNDNVLEPLKNLDEIDMFLKELGWINPFENGMLLV